MREFRDRRDHGTIIKRKIRVTAKIPRSREIKHAAREMLTKEAAKGHSWTYVGVSSPSVEPTEEEVDHLCERYIRNHVQQFIGKSVEDGTYNGTDPDIDIENVDTVWYQPFKNEQVNLDRNEKMFQRSKKKQTDA